MVIPETTEEMLKAGKEAALETTEEILKEAKEVFHSFYSQVSCTDLSAIHAPDCTPLNKNGNRDMEGAVTLDWRADPFVSMSDLTLVVYDGGVSGGVPYHVHTLLLAYGGRKSGFVLEQIKSQSNNRSKSGGGNSGRSRSRSRSRGVSHSSIHRQNSSKSNDSSGNSSNAEYKVDIYVPALAARYMPIFLDYIYGSELKLTTATAPSLRYLSNRFDCRDLHKEVTTRFIPQDLELNTAPQYCTMADELKDFELRDKSIRIMAERFEKMNANLFKYMSPRMMRSLVQCERLECGSICLSEKIAQYLRLRDEMNNFDNQDDEDADDCKKYRVNDETPNQQYTPSLSDEDFYWLTHCQHMPKISPNEALFYINYGTRYPQVMNEIGSGSLKSRCLASCSGNWAMDELTSHLQDSDRNPMELYEKLELKMKVQLLEASLMGAKNMLVEKEKEYSRRNKNERDVSMSNDIMYNNKINRERMASADVMKVVVLGCGVASANGVYIFHQNNNDNHAVMYEKEAVWNQRRVTFVLYPSTSGQYYTQYKLGVRQGNDNNGHIKVLYNSPTVMGGAGGGSGCIPQQAWEVEDDAADGLHPPPQFVGKVEQQQQPGHAGSSSATWNKNLKHSIP